MWRMSLQVNMVCLYSFFCYDDLKDFSERISRDNLSNKVDLAVLTIDRPRIFYTGDIKSTYTALVSSSSRLTRRLPVYFSRRLGTLMWGGLLREEFPTPREMSKEIKENLKMLEREISDIGLDIVVNHIPDFLND